MSQTLEALVVELRADVKGLQTSLQTAAGDVQRFSNKATSSIDGFQAAINRARNQLLSLGLAYKAFTIGRGIVDAGIQMETMRNKMVAATGDAKVAADALAFVRIEAERLGLNIKDATDGFSGFAASALRAGLTLQQTKDIFSGVTEAAVSMRLPAEQVSLVFKALEQIAGKGTVAMEELRGQLGDALPGAFEIAAKAMGKTTAEFTKMVSNGEVMASDFLPKFGAAMRKELGGSVDEASQSAQAAFNRLGNAFFDLQTKMASSGFLDAVTTAVKELTATLNDPSTQQGMASFAGLLGDIATAATKAAAALGTTYGKIRQTVQAAGDKAFASLFGDEGAAAISLARRAKANNITMDAQRAIDAMVAKGGARNGADSTGLSGEAAYPSNSPARVSGSYTLGKPATPLPNAAAEKAAQARQTLRDQLGRMNAGFISEDDPNKTDSAKAIADLNKRYAEEQDLIEKALKKKAITEQEAREESLKMELDYQSRMAEIRKQYRDDFLSDAQAAAEGFLGIQLTMQDKSIGEQASSFRQTISEAAKHNRTFFELEKAASLARALISARESVVSAYAFGSRIGGPPLGAVFAGVAAAAQAVNIAAIASTSFNGGGSNVSDGGGGSSAASTGDTSTSDSTSSSGPSKSVYITLNGDENALFSKNTIRKLIENINDAVGDGTQLKVSLSS